MSVVDTINSCFDVGCDCLEPWPRYAVTKIQGQRVFNGSKYAEMLTDCRQTFGKHISHYLSLLDRFVCIHCALRFAPLNSTTIE